jgi:hypothetical protein
MREVRTAVEIREAVARLLNAGRKVPITVPLPTRLSMSSDAFDDRAANWQIPAHPSFAADRKAVKAAIVAVKAKWDLA